MKGYRWKHLAVLLPATLGLAAWALVPGDLTISLRGPLGEFALGAGIAGGVVVTICLILWVQGANSAAMQTQTLAMEEQRRFLGNLDHQMRSPLTAIQGVLDCLDSAVSESADQAMLALARQQTERLKGIVVTLRQLNDLDKQPFNAAPVDVRELLQDAYDAVLPKARACQRELTFSPGAFPLSSLQGEEALLYQALSNLVDNATKFTQPGGKVEIRAFEDGGYVLIEVSDTGPGIPTAELSRIWEPLYRGEGARGMEGSGLGLPLVRAIIARHGGQVRVRSRVGQGSVFTMRLPLR